MQKLEQLKELHQSEVKALKAKVATLTEQYQQVHASAEPEKLSRHQKQAETAHVTRLERLNQELSTKSRTIQELKRTVERLQRERKSMLFSPTFQPSSTQSKQTGKVPALDLAETFPSTQDEKDYQPGVFSGAHISEVQQENERLRFRHEQLEQQWLEERVSLQAAATQAHAQLQRYADLCFGLGQCITFILLLGYDHSYSQPTECHKYCDMSILIYSQVHKFWDINSISNFYLFDYIGTTMDLKLNE